MNVTVIGAGNSGLAMAAHLSLEGNNVTLWNRSSVNISRLMKTNTIKCQGKIKGNVRISLVTENMEQAITSSDVILITTPASSHKELAKQLAINMKRETLIVLNPGRTFGALEFLSTFRKYNKCITPAIAETQTIMYTCRKIDEDSVNIIAIKSEVLISTFEPLDNIDIISRLPICIQSNFKPAKSMIETSIGNVGMILHCAPLLLNSGWTESKTCSYKYYCDGITPSIASLLEKMDIERVLVSESLGIKVESTKEWMKRTYNIQGDSLYECIQNNEAYKTIEAPNTLMHRYILEDVPCGLVPLEALGKKLGFSMEYTGMIINLASTLLNINFRLKERRFDFIWDDQTEFNEGYFLKRRIYI